MRSIVVQVRGILFCGIMAAILLVPAVWAQPAGEGQMKSGHMDEKGKKHFMEMAEKLKLSKEQQAQLDKDRQQHKAEFESLKEKMSAKRQELREALDSPKLDIAKVTAIHNELKQLIGQREDQHLAAILQIRQILTPEQFAQFQKMVSERKGSHQGPPHGEGE